MDHEDIKKVVKMQVDSVLLSVITNCHSEAQTSGLKRPIKDYKARAEIYTGFPRSYLSALLQQSIHPVIEPSDVFERMLIMKALLKCYEAKPFKPPTFKDIYDIVKDSIKIENHEIFCNHMIEMGFDYKKTTEGHILVEDMKYTFERFNYIQNIRKYRKEKTHIYYLDQRFIDLSLKFPKPSMIGEDSHLNDGFYFYHVVSSRGLGHYLFTNKNTKQIYIKWIFDVLTKGLSPGSLIVIDNNPLHAELASESITRYHSKAEMKRFLKQHNIPFGIAMKKVELYELISKSAKSKEEYAFDKMLRAYGYEVLRLPFGCKNLGPTALLWKQMSLKMTQPEINLNPGPLEDKLVPAIISMIESSWKNLEERIDYWEQQFITINESTEAVLEEICTFDVESIKSGKMHFWESDNI